MSVSENGAQQLISARIVDHEKKMSDLLNTKVQSVSELDELTHKYAVSREVLNLQERVRECQELYEQLGECHE